MRTRTVLSAATAAGALVIGGAGIAWADNVVNNVTSNGTDTFTAGGSTTIGYKVNGTGGDGQTGCNASDGSPATVTLSVPTGVTASKTSLTFNTCGDFQNVTFSSDTAGNYAINVSSISDSGTGSYSNQANFTLHVNPAPVTNTAPVLSLPSDQTVEATGPSGATVTYTATASDAQDGALPTTCTPASGSTFPLGETTVSCSATDSGGLSTTDTFKITVQDTTAPSLSLPGNISTNATSNSQAVVTYSASASDLVDGSVDITCTPASGSTFGLGTTTVSCTATDSHGNPATGSFTVTVKYAWTGFLQPVDKLPTVNTVKAGSAIPVKFSLSGNQGLGVFAAGSPSSSSYTCSAGASTDQIDQTVTAGSSGLSYDPSTDQYTYVWKTDKAWASTCRSLTVKLADNTVQQASFNFTK